MNPPQVYIFTTGKKTQGKPKNTGEGSLSLLQQIFLSQELKLCTAKETVNETKDIEWYKIFANHVTD